MTNKVKHRALISVSIILLIAFFGTGAYLLGWSSLLPVKTVSLIVTGPNDPTFNSNQFINNYLHTYHDDVVVGTPIARLQINQIKNQLKQLEWLEESQISRGWLSGKVIIKVIERVPIATMSTANASGTISYIDKQGIVFHSPKHYGTLPPIVFPTHSSGATTLGNNAGSPELHSIAAEFVTKLPSTLIESVQSIEIFRSDDIEMETSFHSPYLQVKWGGLDEFDSKVAVLYKLLALPENQSITVVDVTDPSSPIVR